MSYGTAGKWMPASAGMTLVLYNVSLVSSFAGHKKRSLYKNPRSLFSAL